MFTAFHSLANRGSMATGWLMGSRVTLLFMKQDITNWVADCQECGRAKVIRQPQSRGYIY